MVTSRLRQRGAKSKPHYQSSMGPSINYVRTKGEEGVKSPIHSHCVLHVHTKKKGGGEGGSR